MERYLFVYPYDGVAVEFFPEDSPDETAFVVNRVISRVRD